MALRLPLLTYPYLGDDDVFIREAIAPLGSYHGNGQPIMFSLLLKGGIWTFGWEHLRVVPFILSLLLLGMTFALGRLLGDRRRAAWATALVAASPWSVFVSAQLDIYGGLFAFLTATLLYFYVKWTQDQQQRHLITAGIIFGLLWLSSFAALIILGAVGIHSLWQRGIRKALRETVLIASVALAVFSLYPLFFSDHFSAAFQKGGMAMDGTAVRFASLATASGLKLYINSFAKALIFMGPLFLWGLFRALLSTSGEKRLSLLLWVCLAYMAGICVLLNPHKLVIYWTGILPLFAVITAYSWIDDRQINKVLALTGLYWLIFVALTLLGPYEIQPIHPGIHISWINLLKFLPVRIFFGPSLSFYIKPVVALSAFAATLILGLGKTRWQKHITAIGLAYCLFCSVEYTYSAFSPDINRIGRKVLADINDSSFKQPVYLHGYGTLSCQRAASAVNSFLYDIGMMSQLTASMEATKGSVIILNSPAMSHETELKQFLSRKASLARTYWDSTIPLAEVWELR